MRRIDVDFKDKDKPSFVKEIYYGLMDEGAVMIRNGISKNKINFYKETAEQVCSDLTSMVINEGVVLKDCKQKYTFEDQKQNRKLYLKDVGFRLNQGHISTQMFQTIFPQFSYHDLISDIPFFQICSQIFNNKFSWFEKSQMRKVSTIVSEGSGWSPPIHFHFDAQYHRPPHSNICFWTALTNCGEDAPSLQVLLETHKEVQRIAEFDPKTRKMNESILEEINRDVTKYFDSANVWKPTFEAGDICLFSTWTLHASHVTKKMKKNRLSAEIRVIGDDADYPFLN